MNKSNLYNYSILTGVWNDLDSDVLKLVKEYLRVHLDRRLLHDDYDEFIERSKIYNPLYYYYNERISYDETDTMSKYLEHDRNYIRYGFKTYYKKDIKIIDDYYRFGYRYYISGTDLYLDTFNLINGVETPEYAGVVTEVEMRLLRKKFMRERLTKEFNGDSFSDDFRKQFIRNLMNVEQGLIEGFYTARKSCELEENFLIENMYFIN